MGDNKNIRNIQSVQRSIDIINCIGNTSHDMSLKEISEHLALNINTVRGLVNTLLNNNFLSKNLFTNRYFLGFEFLSKSQSVYKSHIGYIKELAYPHMHRMAESYAVSCWLQVCFYKEIYTVETVMAPNCHYSYMPKSGAHLPLHSTASGKLLVANLPFEDMTELIDNMTFEKLTKHTISNKRDFLRAIEQAKKNGYTTEFEETDIGISSVGVPFYSKKDLMAGTLSITAPSPTISKIYKSAVVDLLKSGEMITEDICSKNNIK